MEYLVELIHMITSLSIFLKQLSVNTFLNIRCDDKATLS